MPVVSGGGASLPRNARAPWTIVSLQAIFFMPSCGATQGPPVTEKPGEVAIAISSPSRSASLAAKRKASFHSGVMKARRFSTICGVLISISKAWAPAIPLRSIHSRSLRIPSLLTLPFIQCHQTRGLAAAGGLTKARSSESASTNSSVGLKRGSCPATGPDKALTISRAAIRQPALAVIRRPSARSFELVAIS